MPTDDVSSPCGAKDSIAEEFGRHGTLRSNVGCDAMEDPWTNRVGAFALAGSTAHLFHRNSLTSPLLVQCSAPASRWIVSFMDRSFFAMVAAPPYLPSHAGEGREGAAESRWDRPRFIQSPS